MAKRKFLMLAGLASMIYNFNMDNIKILMSLGYDVEVACNMNSYAHSSLERTQAFENELSSMGIKIHNIEFTRNPLNFISIFKNISKLRKLIKKEAYYALHCHIPIASMIARIACIGLKTKVIYTAHGFHFFAGASIKNWLLYYPVEKICSYLTDVLITINEEDYKIAKRDFHAKKLVHLNGVGIDLSKFNVSSEKSTRYELGLNDDDIVLLSVGELCENKNHALVIDAISMLSKKYDISKIKYLICGNGNLRDTLSSKIKKLNLENNVFLLGFRNDINKICKNADIYVFPSHREGLPFSLMEGIASENLAIASDTRGNRELIRDENYRFHSKSVNELYTLLEKILFDKSKLRTVAEIKHIHREIIEKNTANLQKYSKENINLIMEKIYKEI